MEPLEEEELELELELVPDPDELEPPKIASMIPFKMEPKELPPVLGVLLEEELPPKRSSMRPRIKLLKLKDDPQELELEPPNKDLRRPNPKFKSLEKKPFPEPSPLKRSLSKPRPKSRSPPIRSPPLPLEDDEEVEL